LTDEEKKVGGATLYFLTLGDTQLQNNTSFRPIQLGWMSQANKDRKLNKENGTNIVTKEIIYSNSFKKALNTAAEKRVLLLDEENKKIMAELDKNQAELDKNQAELDKNQAELDKNQAELKRQELILEKQRKEIELYEKLRGKQN
jgi:multidrug efflux pump subunit AcrA (membrane-fusion protein)